MRRTTAGLIMFFFSTSLAYAGEEERTLGKHAGFAEFVASQCGEWVETDSGKLAGLNERYQLALTSGSAKDAQKARDDAMVASETLLASGPKSRLKLNCRATTQLLKKDLGEEAPFSLKK
jgi:hypothetical protein